MEGATIIPVEIPCSLEKHMFKTKELKKQRLRMVMSSNGNQDKGCQRDSCEGKLGHTGESQMAHRAS